MSMCLEIFWEGVVYILPEAPRKSRVLGLKIRIKSIHSDLLVFHVGPAERNAAQEPVASLSESRTGTGQVVLIKSFKPAFWKESLYSNDFIPYFKYHWILRAILNHLTVLQVVPRIKNMINTWISRPSNCYNLNKFIGSKVNFHPYRERKEPKPTDLDTGKGTPN